MGALLAVSIAGWLHQLTATPAPGGGLLGLTGVLKPCWLICDVAVDPTLLIFCDGVILSAVGLPLFAGRPERNERHCRPHLTDESTVRCNAGIRRRVNQN